MSRSPILPWLPLLAPLLGVARITLAASWPSLVPPADLKLSWVALETRLQGQACRIAQLQGPDRRVSLPRWFEGLWPELSRGPMTPVQQQGDWMILGKPLRTHWATLQWQTDGLQTTALLSVCHPTTEPSADPAPTGLDLTALEARVLFFQQDQLGFKHATTQVLSSRRPWSGALRLCLSQLRDQAWRVAPGHVAQPPAGQEAHALLLERRQERLYLSIQPAHEGPGSHLVLVHEQLE